VAVLATVPSSDVTDDELDAFCRDNLAGFKLPRAFVRVDEVRRSPSGKADYAWAKQAAEAAATPE
jgi:fatty-acyl-CoA synthase